MEAGRGRRHVGRVKGKKEFTDHGDADDDEEDGDGDTNYAALTVGRKKLGTYDDITDTVGVALRGGSVGARTEEECFLLLQSCRLHLKYHTNTQHRGSPGPPGGPGAGAAAGAVRYKYYFATVVWNEAFVGASRMMPLAMDPGAGEVRV